MIQPATAKTTTRKRRRKKSPVRRGLVTEDWDWELGGRKGKTNPSHACLRCGVRCEVVL